MIDTRSDIYSLGVVLYELLIGVAPYSTEATTLYQAIRVIKDEPPRRPSELNRRFRGDIEAILLKALAKDPAKRYASAADLAQDIRRHLASEPIEARPPGPLTPLVRWAIQHPVAMTALICAGILFATAALTSVGYYAAARRPYKVEVIDEGAAARLKTAAGHVLHSWETGQEGAIRFAQLVKRPAGLGGDRVAILGYKVNNPGMLLNGVAFYDVQGNCEQPIAHLALSDEAIPDILRQREKDTSRTFGADVFGVEYATMADIFDDPPGITAAELVIVFQHEAFTQSALTVYRLDGELLYCVWLDAHLRGITWFSNARLLVCAGISGTAYFREREIPPHECPADANAYPYVVFALQPQRGFISREYVAQEPNRRATVKPELRPKWYYMVHPPSLYDRIALDGRIVASQPESFKSPDAACFNVSIRPIPSDLPYERVRRSWLLDGDGNVTDLRFGRIWDLYGSTDEHPDRPLPPFDAFYLGELPPIREASD